MDVGKERRLEAIQIEDANPMATDQDLNEHDERTLDAQGKHTADLPDGYFTSIGFVGSYAAIAIAFIAGLGGFALIAPMLNEINNSFADHSANINWVAIVYTLMQAIFFLPGGRLSDIFGRRWFFISGSLIALGGSIIAATSQGVTQLILGETFIGIGSSFQLSFFWVVSEIVPMNRRFLATGGLYLCAMPTGTFGPQVGRALNMTAGGWRSVFYLLIALNALSVLCWYLFYHPPSFEMLHTRRSKRALLMEFDFLGMGLFLAGMTLLLLGLNWGGSLYPWSSAHVIGTLLSGAATLIAFGFYQTCFPPKNPYVPLHLCKNMKFMAITWWCSVQAMEFYALGLIWPTAVTVLYPNLGQGASIMVAGLVTTTFVFGQTIGGFLANYVPAKALLIAGTWIGTPLIGAVGANPMNMQLTLALLVAGNLIIGLVDGFGLPMATFPIRSQEEIGAAGGLAGSIRLTGSAIAVAVYSTILNNRLATTVPAHVGPAALAMGVPPDSIPKIISSLLNTRTVSNTTAPGLTDTAVAAILRAFQRASASAYSTVFYSTFGFGGVGMVLAFFTGGVDESDGEYVAGNIRRSSLGHLRRHPEA